MMKLSVILGVLSLSLAAQAATKLSPRQVMECMAKEERTRLAFQDAETALQMKIVTAKQFTDAMKQATSCAQLQKGFQKLGREVLAGAPTQMPRASTSDAMETSYTPNMPKETAQGSTDFDFAPPPPPSWDAF